MQAAYTYQSEVSSRLSPFENSLIGSVPAYGLLDVLGGIAKGNFTAEVFATNVLDKRAETYRFAECTIRPIAGSVVCGDKPLASHHHPAHDRDPLRPALLEASSVPQIDAVHRGCTAFFLEAPTWRDRQMRPDPLKSPASTSRKAYHP